jgi:uncharacterized cofD-like protein
VSDRGDGAERAIKLVALGGGHGLAVVLRAARLYADDISAVVTVADDGGSSGRLRRDLGVVAPGDLRKCLVALASDPIWARAFEHRFRGGDLDGHAFGNLVIVGLAESLGDSLQGLAEAAKVVGAVGRVFPATIGPVVLEADVDGTAVEGQVAVQNSPGRIGRVGLVPADARAPRDVIEAIGGADQVVLAPGSLFTSLLPVLCVAEIRAALAVTTASVTQVANLRPELPETEGLDATDHLRAVLDHGARVDRFIFQEAGPFPADPQAIRELGVEPVAADVVGANGLVHDPAKLATALSALLES